jgi:hypothetical protein
MVLVIWLVGLKDQEGHLSLKFLAEKMGFGKIIDSKHANNMPRGSSLGFGVSKKVSWQA